MQFLDGWRPVAPGPARGVTHGEFCPGAIELQEWLVEKYRLRLLLEGSRKDGEEPEDLTACFRRELCAPLLIAMIQGTSAILNAAGLPKGFKPKSTVVAPPPSRPAPPSLALAATQDGLEDGEGFDSEGADESDSGNSSTTSSDSDPVDNPSSAVPKRSARITQQFGVRQQLPTLPSSASAHFLLDLAGGFPIIITTT
jgi:hypothetical protein